jgi:hypothetical protein
MSPEEYAAKSLLVELELAQLNQQRALEAARLEGFNEGMAHAIETMRDNPDARGVACFIVEDWVRALAQGHPDGLDLSFRRRKRTAEGFTEIAVWSREGRLWSARTLFAVLSAREEHLKTRNQQEQEQGDDHAEDTEER